MKVEVSEMSKCCLCLLATEHFVDKTEFIIDKKKKRQGSKETFAGAVFPLTLASGLYNSLYYRASCEFGLITWFYCYTVAVCS